MLLIDYDEITFDSIKEGDILCRRHFPHRPRKVKKKGNGFVELEHLNPTRVPAPIDALDVVSFESYNYVRPKLG